MASEVEWAWVAGVYEGEGSLALTGVNSAALHIGMTDRDVIERVHRIIGVGQFYVEDRTSSGRLTMYVWRLHLSTDVRDVLQRLLPWLGDRRAARARTALTRLDHVRQQGYCSRNHAMSGDNLYVSPGGQRHCRACARIRDRARRSRSSNGGD